MKQARATNKNGNCTEAILLVQWSLVLLGMMNYKDELEFGNLARARGVSMIKDIKNIIIQ